MPRICIGGGERNGNVQHRYHSGDQPLTRRIFRFKFYHPYSPSERPAGDGLYSVERDFGEQSGSDNLSNTFGVGGESEEQRSLTPSSGEEAASPFVEELDQVQPFEARLSGNSTPIGLDMTLAEPDLLDCPICVERLSPPVYQCENGHLACGLCCIKMNNKCPSCRMPIGYNNRCRAMEKILESIRFLCKNLQYGCTEKVGYNTVLYHENTCKYSPCSCPYPGCEYSGNSRCLYTHFFALHWASSKAFSFNSNIFITVSNNQKHVFLRERTENTLFVLNHSVMPFGSLVSVVCIAPASSENGFSYDLTAIVGETSVNLGTGVELTPKLTEEFCAKKYLVLPKYFANSNGFTELKLTLQKELDGDWRS